jgi:iron complex outermembrane receptor protein
MQVKFVRVFAFVSFVVAAIFEATAGAKAQDVQLPTTVVTAPSPIQRRALNNDNAATPEQGVLPIVEDAFTPITVMTAPEIERSNASTLGDLLSSKPGISSSSFAPGAASRPVIRGLDNFRVRIQENGIGSHDVSDLGEDHGVPIDPLAAQQIEVLRGPATLRWGSQAIGGVVNVTNNRIPEFVPQNGFSMTTKGAVSSVDRGYEGATLMDMGVADGAMHADIYTRRAGDYAIPGGRQANSAFTSDGQSIGASSIGPNGFVGFAITHFDATYHIPGTESAANNTRIHLQQVKYTTKGEYRPDSNGIDAIRFWLGATDYKHDEINDNDGVAATFKNKEQEARIEVQLAPVETWFGPLTSAFGTQLGHQQLGTSGEAGSLLAPTQTGSLAAFLFNELKLTNTLKLQAAGRIEYVDIGGTAAIFPARFLPPGDPVESPFTRHFPLKSASLGLLKELPWNLVASLTGQYVERAPRAPELFSKGAHDAPGTFEIGNPVLTIEKAKTIEVGLRRARGAFRFDATAYYTQFSNFIFKQLTGNTCGEDFASCVAGPGGEFTQIAFAQRDATFYGAEFGSQLDLTRFGRGTLGVDAQYDYVHARFSDGTFVPRIPPQRVGGGVFFRDENWFAHVGLLHAFGHDQIALNETPTGGYNLLKAELSYTKKVTCLGGIPCEFTAGIVGDNLLNESVRNSVSFRKDEVELPGRNVRLFANVRF